MKLVVGLGNPGKKYENTRHNSGWLVLDALRESWSDAGFGNWEKKFDGQICQGKSGREKEYLEIVGLDSPHLDIILRVMSRQRPSRLGLDGLFGLESPSPYSRGRLFLVCLEEPGGYEP